MTQFRGTASFWWQNVLVGKRRAVEPHGDVAIIFGKDERGLHLLRRRSADGTVEARIAQPLVEGRPLAGEVISLRPRADLPFVFDVTTELALGEPASPGEAPPGDAAPSPDGPAQVATDAYQRGWDAIWGARRRTGALN
jgi:hypothetical protein